MTNLNVLKQFYQSVEMFIQVNLLVIIDDLWETTCCESNGHVTNDVT